MRRIIGISALATVGFTGCASSGSGEDTAPPPPPPAQTTTRIATTGARGAQGTAGMSELTLTSTPNVSSVTMTATADEVWKAMIGVYADLGIEVTELNPSARTLGNQQLKVRRRLGKVSLTKYIDCGSTQGGLSAETYEVLLNVTSQVQALSPNSTRVTTNFSSMARPVSISSEYRTCASTGALEKAFGDMLRIRLAM